MITRNFDVYCDVLDLTARVNAEAESVIKTMKKLLEACVDLHNRNIQLIEINEKLLKENAHLKEENAKLKMDPEDDGDPGKMR